jgi:hypothetical protein
VKRVGSLILTDMNQYWISVHRPNGYDHALLLDDAARRDIDAVNEEMKAAGVRVFVGGLCATSSAKVVRPQGNGEVVVSDGPCLTATDYVDGFWVLKCANADEALGWGRKAAVACRASVEIRPFH